MGACAQCKEGEGERSVIFFILVLVMVLALPTIVSCCFVHVYPRQPWPGLGVLFEFVQKRSTKSRIALGFIQVLIRLHLAFNLEMPDSVQNLFRALSIAEVFSFFVSC